MVLTIPIGQRKRLTDNWAPRLLKVTLTVKACAPVFQSKTEERSTAECKTVGAKMGPQSLCLGAAHGRQIAELASSCVAAGLGTGRAWSPLRGQPSWAQEQDGAISLLSQKWTGCSEACHSRQPTSFTPASRSVLTARLGRRCYYPLLAKPLVMDPKLRVPQSKGSESLPRRPNPTARLSRV